MDKETGLYTIYVDGEMYQSSSPITEEMIRRKIGRMQTSEAFNEELGNTSGCAECQEKNKNNNRQS